MSDDWISRFDKILSLADEAAITRQKAIDTIKAFKIAGISRGELESSLLADLLGISGGNMLYASARLVVIAKYLDEVYGSKEST